ncbi:MAG: hypothetical protein IK116_01740 [Firmicutes bacterium]|nr:hypothetical protein [Bacillota bacterium]
MLTTKVMILYLLVFTLVGACFLDGHRRRGWVILAAALTLTVIAWFMGYFSA